MHVTILGTAVAILASSAIAHAEDLGAGKKLYADNCQRCHGPKGQGGVGLKLAGDAAYWDFEIFKRAVLTGIDDEGKHLKKPMPEFGKIGLTMPKKEIPTDAELQDILAYLKTFGPKKADKE
jgi:mono/diheme cytochrome c family protein